MLTPVSPLCAEIGRRVARRRRILGLEQRPIAERLRVPVSHISQLEHGLYQSVKFAHLVALAEVLHTSTDYLPGVMDHDLGVIPPKRSLDAPVFAAYGVQGAGAGPGRRTGGTPGPHATEATP
jgi:transcriptional regulator with XRE-family HTH domain